MGMTYETKVKCFDRLKPFSLRLICAVFIGMILGAGIAGDNGLDPLKTELMLIGGIYTSLTLYHVFREKMKKQVPAVLAVAAVIAVYFALQKGIGVLCAGNTALLKISSLLLTAVIPMVFPAADFLMETVFILTMLLQKKGRIGEEIKSGIAQKAAGRKFEPAGPGEAAGAETEETKAESEETKIEPEEIKVKAEEKKEEPEDKTETPEETKAEREA